MKTLLLSIVLVFAPIKATLLTAGGLVLLDLILGLAAAIKRKEPITSNRMRDTIGKIIAYELAIMIGFLAETYLAKDIPFVNIASTFVALTEGTSCLENLGTITNQNLVQAIVAKINAFKS